MKRHLVAVWLLFSSLFFTGCLWKKKTDETINKKKVEINSDEQKSLDINNIKNENNYYEDDSLDIFSDKNDSSINNEVILEDDLLTPLNPKESIFDDFDSNLIEFTVEESNLLKNNLDDKKIEEDKNIEDQDIFYKEDSFNKDKTNKNEKRLNHFGRILFNFDIFKSITKNEMSVYKDIIKRIKNYAKENNNKIIEVILKGHACDSAGSEEYNLQLSDKRAKTIEKMLMKEEILNINISSHGCGCSEKLVDGNREEQAVNRRVEVYILN